MDFLENKKRSTFFYLSIKNKKLFTGVIWNDLKGNPEFEVIINQMNVNHAVLHIITEDKGKLLEFDLEW